MKYKDLEVRKADRENKKTGWFQKSGMPWKDRVLDCQALYQGTELLEERLPLLLPKAGSDPKYQLKIGIAKRNTINSFANCVNYYQGFLFSTKHPIVMQAGKPDGSDAGKLAPFWKAFFGNVGNGMSFPDLLKYSFTNSGVSQVSGVMAHKPSATRQPISADESEKLGLGDVTLTTIEPLDVFDWEVDESNQLLWIVIGKREYLRPDPREPIVNRDTFWIYDRKYVQTFTNVWKDHNQPTSETELTENPKVEHGFTNRVPVELLYLSDGTWIGNQLRAPAIANLEARTAEAFFLNTTAYCVPVIATDAAKGEDPKVGEMGMIFGVNDKLTWSCPPSESYAGLKSKREDSDLQVYHAANLQGVLQDSSKPWRSAEAKMVDVVQGQITLKSYGADIKNFAERVCSLVANGRGEKLTFTAVGFEHLDDISTGDYVEAVQLASTIDWAALDAISEEFGKDVRKRIALRLLPDHDAETREAIDSQVDAQPKAEPKPAPVPTVPQKQVFPTN